METEKIKQELTGPDPRGVICEILAHGVNLPPAVKAMAFIAVNRMGEEELSRVANIAILALECVENKDLEGLRALLKSAGVPPQFLGVISAYAENFN